METPIDPIKNILARKRLYAPPIGRNVICDHALDKPSSSGFLNLGRYEKPLIFEVASKEYPCRHISAAGPEASAGTGRKKKSLDALLSAPKCISIETDHNKNLIKNKLKSLICGKPS
jgi:hypothetical protein